MRQGHSKSPASIADGTGRAYANGVAPACDPVDPCLDGGDDASENALGGAIVTTSSRDAVRPHGCAHVALERRVRLVDGEDSDAIAYTIAPELREEERHVRLKLTSH